MTEASASPAASVRASWLFVLLIAWLAADQLLLACFLGLSPLLIFCGAVIALVLVWRTSVAGELKNDGREVGIPLVRLILCITFALALLVLAGEGRWFYSNIDWQVRDAVLRDMAIHPWPFVYDISDRTGDDAAHLLRAPIGMFLLPSLAYKVGGGVAGDLALLAQNGILIGTLLALGSLLFDSRRARWIALACVTLFSGLDLIGTLIFHGPVRDHLEFWFDTLQFSSHVTQLFWVPQHAFAGWLSALLFLLWRQGRLRLWLFFAMVPMTALWSPLALIGAMPFAIWAGWSTLRQRALTVGDIGWPTLSLILVAPGLLYLASAGDGVGIRPYPVQLLAWAIFVLLEVLVFALPLLLGHKTSRFGPAPLWIALLWLLLCPFVQIGWSLDFMMRTSIPSLAVLAVLVADGLHSAPSRTLRGWLTATLLIGSVTGLSEIRRAFVYPVSPRGSCSFFGAWDVSFARYRKDSYLAPLDKVPGIIKPTDPARVLVNDPSPCWQGAWPRPEGV